MVTGSSPMKEKFVALHMPSTSAGAPKSTSIWRRWNRLTACQKRSLIVVLVLFVTTYAVGEQLHELHLKSKKIEKGAKRKSKHKNGENKGEINYNDPTENDNYIYEEQPSYEDYVADQKDETENEIKKSEDDQYQIQSEDEIQQKPLGENIFEQNQANDGVNYQDHSAKSWRGNGVESAKQLAIKLAFQHAWKGYKQFAWGHDMLKPMSKRYEDWFSTQTDHMGLTLIDSLDVMVIMGLDEEFSEAREFVDKELSLAPDRDQINLFECTIRVLGGFLSTYHLTNDDLFKEKAIEIGDRLLPAITASKSSVPYSDVNLKKRQAHSPRWGSSSSTSEVTTIQMEFSDLSFLTGDSKYEDYVYNVSKHISKLPGKLDGLVPMWISPESGQFNSKAGSTITLGARTDSYYEYLFKRWYQEKTPKYEFMLEDFKTAMKGVKKHLFGRTKPNNYLIVGEKIGNRFSPKMDHLVCFLPGTIALAHSVGQLDKEWLNHSIEIGDLCNQFYNTETGLAPEISYFNLDSDEKSDLDIHTNDRFSILRPETVESYFYLWRLTKNQKYRDWGWAFFENLEKYARVENGYTSISNVMSSKNPGNRDKMESFFLGETLKYLYLLFSDDDFLPLSDWVFNTEAHPLPVRK